MQNNSKASCWELKRAFVWRGREEEGIRGLCANRVSKEAQWLPRARLKMLTSMSIKVPL